MKAIIFSHEDGGTYVMDSDGSFRFVKGYTTQPIGAEIEIKNQTPVYFMKIMPAAACFILVITLSIFTLMWNTVNYSVYVDINPSVELMFNSFNRLKTAIPINEDGEELLDGLKLNGSVADIVITLINSAEQKGYLDARGGTIAVLITVVARGNRSTEEYVSAIKASLDENKKSGFTLVESCSMEIRDRAMEL